jgi:hypothetical protein
LTESELKSYVGKYKGPQSGVGEVVSEDGHLVLVLGAKRIPLLAAGQGVFFMKERDLTFSFTNEKLVVRERGAVAEALVRQ